MKKGFYEHNMEFVELNLPKTLLGTSVAQNIAAIFQRYLYNDDMYMSATQLYINNLPIWYSTAKLWIADMDC